MKILFVAAIFVAVSVFPAAVLADDTVDFYGDFRLRFEQDWDSLHGDGTERDDRGRLRIRVRGGIDFKFNDHWSAKIQARSGPNNSQQSPHITIHDFDGGSDGPYEFNLDHWYVGYANDGFTAWAGRNSLAAWHQDDMFIFDNVTYAGLGGSYRHDFASGDLTWYLNYVQLPIGMRAYSGDGVFGEVAYNRNFGERGLTAALSWFGTNADPNDSDSVNLLTDNGARDYSVVNLQFQYRTHVGTKPLRFGIGYSYNTENYNNLPLNSFSEFHKDDIDGYVVEFLWGDTKAANDWLFGYYYTDLGALAVHSSYTQDDWVRWGTSTQARATNMKGSEFRVHYTIRPGMNIIARLFSVDGSDLLEFGDTTKETGNRLRIDWNTSF